MSDLTRTIEALLFLSPQPVNARDLAEATEAEEGQVEEAIALLREDLAEGKRGVVLREVAGGFALASDPFSEEAARRLLAKPRTPPLTQARIVIRLKDGRELQATADGARGYPEHPASDEELAAKFLACAERAMPRDAAAQAICTLRGMAQLADVRSLTRLLAGEPAQLLSPRP